VFAVVHHQQELLIAYIRQEKGKRVGPGLVAEVQGCHDGVADQHGIAKVSQFN